MYANHCGGIARRLKRISYHQRNRLSAEYYFVIKQWTEWLPGRAHWILEEETEICTARPILMR